MGEILDDGYTTMTDEQRAKVQSVIDRTTHVGEAIGGWKGKSDCRLSGFSYYAKFDRNVDVTVSIEAMDIFQQAPPMLTNACERLLAADDEIKRLRAEIERG